MNELSSINCEIVSLRPSPLLEVILYGDKMLNDKSNHRILLRISITLKICNGLNRPYFKYLVDTLTVYEETVRSYVCIVFFFFCLFIFIMSNVSEYNVHYYYRKKNLFENQSRP